MRRLVQSLLREMMKMREKITEKMRCCVDSCFLFSFGIVLLATSLYAVLYV